MHARDKYNRCNVETPSHDDSNSHIFSSDGHEFAGMALWPPLDPLLTVLLFHFHATYTWTQTVLSPKSIKTPVSVSSLQHKRQPRNKSVTISWQFPGSVAI